MARKAWRIWGTLYQWLVLAVLLTVFGFGIWKIAPASTRLWAKILLLVVLGVNFRLIQIYEARNRDKIAENVGRNNGNS